MEGECCLNKSRTITESHLEDVEENRTITAFHLKDINENRKRKRTTDAGRRTVGGRIYDSTLGKTCHWCRQKTVDARVGCSRGGCTVLFCGGCLRNRHGEDIVEQSRECVYWVCPSCRGGCGTGCTISCCNCGPCRKKRGLTCTGQMIQGARASGFTNVHDYLIHLQTGESPEAIGQRKIGRHWIAEPGSSSACPSPSAIEVPIQDQMGGALLELYSGEAQQFLLEHGEKVEVEEAEQVEAGKLADEEIQMLNCGSETGKEAAGILHDLEMTDDTGAEQAEASTSKSLENVDSNNANDNGQAKQIENNRVVAGDWRRQYYDDSGSECEEDDYWGRERTQVKKQPQGEVSNYAHLLTHKQAEDSQDFERQRQRAVEHASKFKASLKESSVNFMHLLASGPDPEEERPLKSSVTEDTDSGASNDKADDAQRYKHKLQKALSAPFDSQQLKYMLEEVNMRKPLLKHRETRHGTSSVATGDKAASYLDRYPGLAFKIAAADEKEKLQHLRGFFFWIQHACHPGAFQPWADVGDEKCRTDPDCQITAVVSTPEIKRRLVRRKWTSKAPKNESAVE